MVGVEKSELLSVAREKLLTNHADFILANDLENIHLRGILHPFYFLPQTKILAYVDQKLLRNHTNSNFRDPTSLKNDKDVENFLWYFRL